MYIYKVSTVLVSSTKNPKTISRWDRYRQVPYSRLSKSSLGDDIQLAIKPRPEEINLKKFGSSLFYAGKSGDHKSSGLIISMA